MSQKWHHEKGPQIIALHFNNLWTLTQRARVTWLQSKEEEKRGKSWEENNGNKLGETGKQSHSQFSPATISFHSLDQFKCKHTKDPQHVEMCMCVGSRGKSACPEWNSFVKVQLTLGLGKWRLEFVFYSSCIASDN